jgi:ribosome-associated protein
MKVTPEFMDRLLSECAFRSVTSGGKGGQNVNKVATKVELYFNIRDSRLLDERSKELILSKYPSRISSDGMMRIVSSAERSQHQNRKAAAGKFRELIENALRKTAVRKPTGVPTKEREERLRRKKLRSELKKLRRGPENH